MNTESWTPQNECMNHQIVHLTNKQIYDEMFADLHFCVVLDELLHVVELGLDLRLEVLQLLLMLLLLSHLHK